LNTYDSGFVMMSSCGIQYYTGLQCIAVLKHSHSYEGMKSVANW